MRRFLVGFVIGIALGLSVPTTADIIGAGWRSKNDAASTYEPALPTGFVSSMSSINCGDIEPAVAAFVYVRPTGTGCDCEGGFMGVTAAGKRCFYGVEP
jgi:hypothetical protein